MAQSSEIAQLELIHKGFETVNTDINKTVENYLKLVKTINEGNKTIGSTVTSFDGLNKAQKQTTDNTKQLDALDKKLIASEQRLKDITDERTKKLIANNVEVQKETAAIKQNIIIQTAQKGSYEKINAALNSNIAAYKKLSAEERANKAIGGELIATIQGQDKALKDLDSQMGRSQRNVGNYGSAIAGVGKSLLGAFGVVGGVFAIASVLKDTVSRIREFDSAMQNMAGVAGVSRSELKEVEETIKSVAGASVKTSNEVAQLAEVLFTLGKTKEDVINMLAPVNNLAIGLETTSDNAANLLGQTLNAFGKGSESAGEFADIIANMRTSTALNFEKIEGALGYLAPTAKALNITLGQTGAIIGTIQDNGKDAVSAAALLNTSFARLINKGLTLDQALLKINESTNKVKTANELFGARSFGLALILADNVDRVKELGAEFDNLSSGSLKKLTDEQLKSLDSKLAILDSTWEKFILDIDAGRGPIATVIGSIVVFATNAISALGDLGKKWYEIVGEINANAVIAASDNALASALIEDRKEVELMAKSLMEKGVPAAEANNRAVQSLILSYQKLVGYGVENTEQVNKQIEALRKMSETIGKKSQEEINAEEAAAKAKEKAAKESAKNAKEFKKEQQRIEAEKAKIITDSLKKQEQLILSGGEEKNRINEKLVKDENDLMDEALKDAMSRDEKEFNNWYDLEKKKREKSEEEADKEKELKKETAEKIRDLQIEIAREAINGIFDLSSAKRDEEMLALDAQREKELSNKNLTEAQKQRINEEYDKKAAAIKTKQAKADKEQALFNIAINTAVAATKAAPNVELIALTILLGAIQAGIVLAKPIPKFKDGTKNAPDRGIFGEAGRELMFLRSGEVGLANKATYFEGSKFKGAQILSNPETEKMISMNDSIGGRQMTDDRILNGLKGVERAIMNKPVAIFDKENRAIGHATSHSQTIYLNRLMRNN